MKKILFLFGLFLCSGAFAQNYWYDKSVTSSIDTSDLLMIYQSAVTKNFSVGTLSALINDTADQVRSEAWDSIASLRTEIGGSSIWTRTNDSVYLTNYSTDVFLIGQNGDPYANYYDLICNGRAKFETSVDVGDDATLGGVLQLQSSDYLIGRDGDDMIFYDVNNPQGYTL